MNVNQCGRLCVEPWEIGRILNEYLSSVFTVEEMIETRGIRDEHRDVLKRIDIMKRGFDTINIDKGQ